MYEKQLELIRWLHEFRNPWLDGFFEYLNYFDRAEFFFVLIPAIWIGYHWKSGLRIFYILMLSSIVNGVLKNFFMEPRPFHIDPSLGIIEVSGYGFPSGAAQTVILLSGILLNSYRNKWTWILCINYVFWISLSRVYLGVHLPTDILGGWIVGALLWALYTYVRPPLEKWLEKLSLPRLFFISIIAPLFIAGLSLRWCIIAITLGIGLCLSKHLKILLSFPKDQKELMTRAVIGVLVTFFLASLDHWILIDKGLWDAFIQPILVGLWISLGASSLFHFRSRS